MRVLPSFFLTPSLTTTPSSIHREGQQRVCVIYRFFTAGTIDEKIFQRQITKQGLSSSIMVRSASPASLLDVVLTVRLRNRARK